jgi:hypothetical protein
MTAALIAVLAVAGCSSTATQTAVVAPQSSTASPTSPPVAAATPTPFVPAPVPSQYQATYSTLQSQVAGFTAIAGTDPANSSTVISSGLEAADGNAMKPGVLQTNALNTTTKMINQMKALGETGVTIQVGFPLLVSSFPDNSEYTTFYQEVAQAVHQAGLTLTVEENPLFGNITKLPVQSFFAGLNLQSYAADTQQEAQTIINVMHPSQLSILNEPDTSTDNIHNHSIDLKNSANGVEFVNLVLNGLNRNGTAVGAGTGTWQDGSYDQALLTQTSIDFIDMHTYFITQADLGYMQSQVAEAAAAHKPIVMTECWLYKNSTNGLPVDTQQGAPDEQKLVTYSFWEPLDQQFLTDMVSYARNNNFEVVSAFSTESFFAYQTWTPALDAQASKAVRSAFYKQVAPALASGQVTAVGDTYKKLATA